MFSCFRAAFARLEMLAANWPLLYNAFGVNMKNLFFLDVDTQRDFMLPTGALYVPGAERILPKLRRLFDFARKNEISILSSVDAHVPDDPEFKQFPPHCVQGTEGQRKVDETLLPRSLVFRISRSIAICRRQCGNISRSSWKNSRWIFLAIQ